MYRQSSGLSKQANLFYLLISVTSLFIVNRYLFLGASKLGVYYDEVLRTLPYIQVLFPKALPDNQGTFYVDLFGLHLPLVFKEYVSSISHLFLVPALFFDDPQRGLKIMEEFYSLVGALGFWLFLRRWGNGFALIVSLAAIASPLMFPDLLVGTAWLFPPAIACWSLHLMARYWESKRQIFFFCSLFIMALLINIKFYAVWSFCAFVLAAFILWPRQFMQVALSWQRLLLAIAAFGLGLFNFVYYNIATGGATFKPVFNYIFDNEAYNKTPIDFQKQNPLWDSILLKLEGYRIFWSGSLWPYSVLFVCAFVGTLLFLLIKRDRVTSQVRTLIYFVFLVFGIIVVEILISPKAHRPEHLAYLKPWLEIIICLPFYWLVSRNAGFFGKIVGVSCLVFLLWISISVSRRFNDRVIDRSPFRNHSPAIRDVLAFLQSEKETERLFEVDWGFGASLYFLSKGQVQTSVLMYGLMELNEDQAVDWLGKTFKQIHDWNKVYFIAATQPLNTNQLFAKVIERLHFKVNEVRSFSHTRVNGESEPIFHIFKIEKISNVVGEHPL